MKRFALATALLAMMGLTIGCGGDAATPPADTTPEVTEPAGDDAAPAEGEEEAAGDEEAAE